MTNSFTSLFPFGVWNSVTPTNRFRLDFNEDGCVWQELSSRGSASDVLRRIVPLIKTATGWRIERPNDGEVLAFLDAAPGVIQQILSRGANPSFLDLNVRANQFQATWNGLRWTLNNQGDLNTLDQPGSTLQTMGIYEFTREGDDSSYLRVTKGQLTFDLEGNEGEPYHSRMIHWPGYSSGVTLGRGYDIGRGMSRTSNAVAADLRNVGVEVSLAARIAGGAGLTGEQAHQFVLNNQANLGNITLGQQKRLFELTYNWHENDIIRILNGNSTNPGGVNWPGLDARIRTIMVDLRFAGDYRHVDIPILQTTIDMNDLVGFTRAMGMLKYWAGLRNRNSRRFHARLAYLGGRIIPDRPGVRDGRRL